LIGNVFRHMPENFELTRQRWRQLGVDEEAHLCAPKNRMVVLSRGELEYGRDVLGLQVGVVGEDLVVSRTSREEVEHVLHPNPEAADAGAATTD
jgi:hypothetical protein